MHFKVPIQQGTYKQAYVWTRVLKSMKWLRHLQCQFKHLADVEHASELEAYGSTSLVWWLAERKERKLRARFKILENMNSVERLENGSCKFCIWFKSKCIPLQDL